MKKTTTTAQAPKVETRPIALKAYTAAYEVRNGLKEYNTHRADVMRRMAEMPEQIERDASYGSVSDQAGQIATMITRIGDNMRLDLLVRYAARAEVGQATLDAIRDQLTDDEHAQVNRILGVE